MTKHECPTLFQYLAARAAGPEAVAALWANVPASTPPASSSAGTKATPTKTAPPEGTQRALL